MEKTNTGDVTKTNQLGYVYICIILDLNVKNVVFWWILVKYQGYRLNVKKPSSNMANVSQIERRGKKTDKQVHGCWPPAARVMP